MNGRRGVNMVVSYVSTLRPPVLPLVVSTATPASGTRLSVQLRVLTAGAAHDQFYLPEISSCWDLDGSPCVPGTGAIGTAITRYTCFIIAPNVTGACSAKNQNSCPPYHVAIDGTRISRNDTVRAAPKFVCRLKVDFPPLSSVGPIPLLLLLHVLPT